MNLKIEAEFLLDRLAELEIPDELTADWNGHITPAAARVKAALQKSTGTTKVYLAGGLKSGWADRVIELCPGVSFLDPRAWQVPNPYVYTDRDLAAIRTCDVVLAQMGGDNPSGFGMSLEVGYALALGKKIIFLDEIGGDWRSRYFGMHRVVASAVVNTAEEAAEVLNTGGGSNGRRDPISSLSPT